MKQGKKQSKFDFETTIIGITWLLVLFMFTVSIVSCDSEPEEPEPLCNAVEIYCQSRTSWYECTADGWHLTGKGLHYCENDVIYEGDLGACEGEEIVEYVCEVWACEDGTFARYYKPDCDPESVLP